MPTTKERRKKEETKDAEYLITYTRHLEKRLRNLETENQELDAERLRLEMEVHSLKNTIAIVEERDIKLQKAEVLKEEYEQQLFFNMLGDQAIIEKLKNVANVSSQIRLEMLRNILNIIDENKEFFDSKIFEWAYQFGFKIDGDFLIFEKDAMIEFIRNLENKFDEWYKNEMEKIEKKDNSNFRKSLEKKFNKIDEWLKVDRVKKER